MLFFKATYLKYATFPSALTEKQLRRGTQFLWLHKTYLWNPKLHFQRCFLMDGNVVGILPSSVNITVSYTKHFFHDKHFQHPQGLLLLGAQWELGIFRVWPCSLLLRTPGLTLFVACCINTLLLCGCFLEPRWDTVKYNTHNLCCKVLKQRQ